MLSTHSYITSSLLPVAYVRNLSGSHVTWSCIYTRMLSIVCLHVMYVRNLSNMYLEVTSTPHNGEHPFMCAVLRNPSSSPMPWRCIYTLILEGDHFFVVFVGNLSSILMPRMCTYTLIHSLAVYMLYVWEYIEDVRCIEGLNHWI